MNLVVKVCVAEVQGSVLDAEYAYPHGRSELQASVKWCNFIIIFIFMFYSAPGRAAHTRTHSYICVCFCVWQASACVSVPGWFFFRALWHVGPSLFSVRNMSERELYWAGKGQAVLKGRFFVLKMKACFCSSTVLKGIGSKNALVPCEKLLILLALIRCRRHRVMAISCWSII
jgi:hypothetical protein